MITIPLWIWIVFVAALMVTTAIQTWEAIDRLRARKLAKNNLLAWKPSDPGYIMPRRDLDWQREALRKLNKDSIFPKGIKFHQELIEKSKSDSSICLNPNCLGYGKSMNESGHELGHARSNPGGMV